MEQDTTAQTLMQTRELPVGFKIRHFDGEKTPSTTGLLRGAMHLFQDIIASSGSGVGMNPHHVFGLQVMFPLSARGFSLGFRISEDGSYVDMTAAALNEEDAKNHCASFTRAIAKNTLVSRFAGDERRGLLSVDTSTVKAKAAEEKAAILSKYHKEVSAYPHASIRLTYKEVLALLGITEETWSEFFLCHSQIYWLNKTQDDKEVLEQMCNIKNLHSFSTDIMFYVTLLCLTHITRLGSLIVTGNRDWFSLPRAKAYRSENIPERFL